MIVHSEAEACGHMTVMICGMFLVILFESEIRTMKSNVAVFKFRFGKKQLCDRTNQSGKSLFF